jgi:signal transduction histidine kinase/CheY-like chemotaxis protein/HPt (histidine-containing phosphotransfer) domain-containing protein
MRELRSIARHSLLAISFLALFLLLNRPEIILLSRLGYVVWYPAVGLVLGLMLGVSPWYAPLVYLSTVIAGKLFYNQPLATFGETIGALGGAGCYAAAAYVLRGPLRIDSGLRRRRDVVLYVSITTIAALGSTAIGVASLAADHTIRWSEYWQSASVWFLGDEIGLLGVAPFLLIHVLPWVRKFIAPAADIAPAGAQKSSGKRYRTLQIIEALSQAVSLAVLLWVMFGSTLARFELFFLSFIPIIWIAMRQGIRRVVCGLLVLNFGIVVALHSFPATADLLSKIGLLMFVTSAVGLLVGSAVTERHRIAIELFERTAELQEVNTQLLASKQKAEEASRAKGEFLANMSHEIRTPINGVLGMADLLLNTATTAEQHDYLTLLKSSAGSLLRIVNDILDFSRVESGRLELCPVEFSLRDTIGKTVKALALQAREKGLDLVLETAPQVPDSLVGDSGRLCQVLINLLGNAIKFTPSGKIAVRVQVDSESATGLRLHFSVTDTGIGIPAEKHALIFDAFSQADGSITRNYGGTGLGLAICSRLVALLGGRIWLQSAVGQGSTFHFTASFEPVAHSSAAKAQEDRSPSMKQVPAEGPGELCILVAEDNLVNQTVILSMLTRLGHRPTIAQNGVQALSLLEAGTFDLVFMDVQMPEMDGLTATRKIRESEQKTLKHIPIVAMTAHAMKGDRESCLAAGMDHYISKPASGDEIRDLIASIFSAQDFLGSNKATPPAKTADSRNAMQGLRKFDGDESLLRELIHIFLDESPKQLDRLSRAAESGDWQTIERTAHSLKGELNCLGFIEMGEKAREIELIGRKRLSLSAKDAIFNFRTEVDALTTVMKKILETDQSLVG